jgi:carotenoid cleavage dioxygenase
MTVVPLMLPLPLMLPMPPLNQQAPAISYRTNHAPIDFELADEPLRVRGVLPAGLAGVLVRNGPNPLRVDPAQHWFAGHGMVHRFEFASGQVRYRNRWVRTQRWLGERAGASAEERALGAGTAQGLPRDDGVANTNVLMHGARLLALEEAHLPIELHPQTLDTLRQVDFGGALQGAFTAHPKVDPRTGELLFFSYGGPDGLGAGMTAGSIDANGRVQQVRQFEAPYASMVHDFAFTAQHMLFPVMPLTGSAARARAHAPAYAWEPQVGTFVGIMRRDGSAEPDWWQGPVCFVYHVMNAWEEGERIYMDVMQSDAPSGFTWPDGSPIEGAGHARLCRWTFDLHGKERVFTSALIANVEGEFPRIDERFAGSAYHHGWLAAHSDGEHGLFTQIVHVDQGDRSSTRRLETLSNTRLDIYPLEAGDSTSEPVFVPRAVDAPEGDGWLLAVIFRGAQMRSDLLVFDALHVATGPLVTVEVPHRIPNGFHGNWVAAG